MHDTSELIGRPVLDLSTGKEIGKIREILIDLATRSVAAFEINVGFFQKATFILWTDLKNVGPDALTLPSRDLLKERATVDPDNKLEYHLSGRSMFTVSGEILGKVRSYRIALDTGALVGFDIIPSDAPRRLFQSSPSNATDVFVRIDEVKTLGHDSIIVNDKVRELLRGANSLVAS